jgi:hypothetical protein
MKLITLVIAAALTSGCVVHNDERSFLVGTRIVAAVANPDATIGGCAYDPDTAESVFGAFDPAFGYVHAVVVENRLPDNSGLGPGRINTNDFQVEGATVTTEVLIGPAQSIGTQTVPANGFIPIAGSLPVAVVLAQPGAIAAGSTVRFNIQVFGHFLDGSSAKSNRYEYAASAVPGFVQAGAPTCVAPQAATGCEGADPAGISHQDTTVICL